MARYDDQDRNDDFDYGDIRIGRHRRRDGADAAGPRPQSGLGIASIGLSIVVFLGYLLVLGLAIALAANANGPPQNDDPLTALVGLGALGSGCLNVVGLVLGIVGCFQSDRGLLCPILGTIFNGILFLGMILLVLAGIFFG